MAAREAIALDKYEPVKTVIIDGRQHKLHIKECNFCHASFETTYINARYCNDTCKNNQAKDREKQRRRGVIICFFCGKESPCIDKRRKFCQTSCREAMRKLSGGKPNGP